MAGQFDPIPEVFSPQMGSTVRSMLSLDPLARPTLEQLHPVAAQLAVQFGVPLEQVQAIPPPT